MHFQVNQELLSRAGSILARRSRVYWIVGGACSGKSTICRAIAAQCGIPIYDMDSHLFGDYPSRCTQARHPALKTWFAAPDPFAWLLGLPPDEFEVFNRATTAEYLDLLADDLRGAEPDDALLIDGGITNPALLAQVMPVSRIVCMETPEAMSARIWEESAERRSMKEMALQLPNPEAAWSKFLLFDRLMTRTILRECRESGIAVVTRDGSTPLSASVERVAGLLGVVGSGA